MNHLTQAELESLRLRLEHMLRDTRDQARATEEELHAEVEAKASDSIDQRDSAAGAESREQVDRVLLDHQLGELNEVDAALLRIRKGEYGICTDCHEPIAYERLRAYPTAMRCPACQVDHERHGARRRQ